MEDLSMFVKMSHYAGAREDLVQAGGGNSGLKIDRCRMVIKASGYQMADISEKEGYAVVNYDKIRTLFLECDDILQMTDEISREILGDAFIKGAKPSIETFLHSIAGKFSLHTHPIVVNAVACRKTGQNILEELFQDALIVGYATPGIELAKAYFQSYKKYKNDFQCEPRIVFLLNHGLMVSGDTAEETIGLTENITKKLEKFLGVDCSPYHAASMLSGWFADGIIWRATDYNVIKAKKILGNRWRHDFCPDCVVFLGKRMLVIDSEKSAKAQFDEFTRESGYPTVIAYNDDIYIHAESVKEALKIQSVLSFSAQVMMLNLGQECSLLDNKEMDFLLKWDAERYRKNMK